MCGLYREYNFHFYDKIVYPYIENIESENIELEERVIGIPEAEKSLFPECEKIVNEVRNSGEVTGLHYVDEINNQRDINNIILHSHVANLYANNNIITFPAFSEFTQDNTFGLNAKVKLKNLYNFFKEFRKMEDFNNVCLIPDTFFQHIKKSPSSQSNETIDDLKIILEKSDGTNIPLQKLIKLKDISEFNINYFTFPATNHNNYWQTLMKFHEWTPSTESIKENAYMHKSLQDARLLKGNTKFNLNYLNNLTKSSVCKFKSKYSSKHFRNYLKEGPFKEVIDDIDNLDDENVFIRAVNVSASDFNEKLQQNENAINEIKMTIKRRKKNSFKYIFLISGGIALNIFYHVNFDNYNVSVVDFYTLMLLNSLLPFVKSESDNINEINYELESKLEDITSFFIDLKLIDKNKFNF